MVQRFLVTTAARATVFGARVRRFLSEPEREPADLDNMFSNALNMVRRQAIPPVEKATKVRDPARGIPLCTRMVRIGAFMDVSMPGLEFVSTPRSMALLDGAGPVPSDQVGRLSNNTSELHAITVGLL